MQAGTSLLGKDLLINQRWPRLYLKQSENLPSGKIPAHYELSNGLALGETVEARLVKVWRTRDSGGSMELQWADRCSSYDGVHPNRFVKLPPSQTCELCPRLHPLSKGDLRCSEIYQLGLYLADYECLCILEGKKNARRPVMKLINRLIVSGSVDLLMVNVSLKFGYQAEKQGSLLYEGLTVASAVSPEEPLEEEIAAQVFSYELAELEADAAEKKTF